MLMDPLVQNKNMNLRTVDHGSASGGSQNPSNTINGHGFINIMSAKNGVMHAKDYGMSQPRLGKEPTSPKISLRIENPSDNLEALPHIPKGVFKCLRYNPNALAA